MIMANIEPHSIASPGIESDLVARAVRRHRLDANPIGIASLLRPDMIFRRDKTELRARHRKNRSKFWQRATDSKNDVGEFSPESPESQRTVPSGHVNPTEATADTCQ
jgi:hypothetical protein